jgi:hypothetical protein
MLHALLADQGSMLGRIGDFMPSGIWFLGLCIGVVICAIPALLGVALDGKGQAASGWVLLLGLLFGLFAIGCFLLLYLGGSLLYGIVSFVMGF